MRHVATQNYTLFTSDRTVDLVPTVLDLALVAQVLQFTGLFDQGHWKYVQTDVDCFKGDSYRVVVVTIVDCIGNHADVGSALPLTFAGTNDSFHFNASCVATVKGVVAAQEEAVQGYPELRIQCGFVPHGVY